MDAFLMSSGVPQSRSQAPAPGRSERQTALFRVFVFEAEDGDIKCVKEDERALLSLMMKASKGDVSLAAFASFSVRALPASKKKSRRSQLRVTCGLVKHPYGADASDDERLGGAAQLFHACGFTLSDGSKVKLVDDVASTGLEDAWVCRLHTFAHTDQIRAAFVARGLQAEHILDVKVVFHEGTDVATNVKLVFISPAVNKDALPWKVALQEQGKALGLCRAVLQGSYCLICRACDHRMKECPCKKQDLCGRCEFPLRELKKRASKHDCEGGPAGYGAAHADHTGEKWHAVWRQHENARVQRKTEADPVPPEVVANLDAAKAAARAARETATKRKAARQTNHLNVTAAAETPPAKRHQSESMVPSGIQLSEPAVPIANATGLN
jgi:hypothetical protein